MVLTGAEITLGYQAIKSAIGLAKEAKDLTDTTAIKAKVIEMQSLLLDAQSSAIEAREAHAVQATKIAELETEISRLKSWEAERQRYELVGIASNMFAYMLKAEFRNQLPPHWLCPNCFEDGKKSIFQRKVEMYVNCDCIRCGASIGPDAEPTWR